MFTKLLKYEWRNSRGLLGILCGCILGIGLLASVALRFIIETAENAVDDAVALAIIPSSLFLFLAFLSVAVLTAAVPLVLLYRFYKTRFTDQGYLTFTLPAKTSDIFLSSAMNILIWEAITFCTILLAFIAVIGIGIPGWASEELPEGILPYLYDEYSDVYNLSSLAIAIASILINCAYSIIVPMCSIVIGAVVAKKHKILAAIGICYGISIVNSVISGIISGVVQVSIMMGSVDMENLVTISNIASLVNLILPLGLTIAGYFLSIHLMKNKLNLP